MCIVMLKRADFLWTRALRCLFLPPEVAAGLQCGGAAACSSGSSPVRGSSVSGTPAAPLRIFPLTLRFRDSFISVRAAARVCPDRICPHHPSICPSSICVREGQTHRFLISGPDNFSSFLILCPDFFFPFCFWRFITGRVIPALSRRWWVLPPVFVFMRGASPSGDSTATRRCGGDQTCGQAAGRSAI